jgi:hypothetical protein
MAHPFFNRLKEYFEDVSAVLKGEAEASSIFPNTSDIGVSRELIYAEFLKQHVPSKCNVFLGGFLFGEDGEESKQLDVIISTDTAPRYNFLNQDGRGKSFGPVEGTLGVASIKSTLNKEQLIDSLLGIASIPANLPIGKRLNPLIRMSNYEDWPYKIIYASDGIAAETLLAHLNSFYKSATHIPLSRRPHIIHVAGKYVIFRIKEDMSIKNLDGTKENAEIGTFHIIKTDSDMQAIVWTLDELQHLATAATHINFNYSAIINKINGI